MAVELATGYVSLTVSARGLGKGILQDVSKEVAGEGKAIGRDIGTDLANEVEKAGKSAGSKVSAALKAESPQIDVDFEIDESGINKAKTALDGIGDDVDLSKLDFNFPVPKFEVPRDAVADIQAKINKLGDEPLDLDLRVNQQKIKRIKSEIDRLEDDSIDLDIDIGESLAPLRNQIEQKLGNDVDVDIEADIDESDAKSLGDQFGGAFLTGAAVVTGGLAALLAAGVAFAISEGLGAAEREANLDLQGARFGLDEEETARRGTIAGQVYAENFGESAAANFQVSVNLGTALEFDGMSDREVADSIIDVNAVASFLAVDVAEATQFTATSINTGLADNTRDISDSIIGGLTGLTDQARQEIPDFANEYSQFFSALGLSWDDVIRIIQAGDVSTAMDLDRLADSFKEVEDIITEAGPEATAALAAIDLDIDVLADQIAEGGPAAEGALVDVFTGLAGVTNKREQENLFETLFGSPGDDIGDFDFDAFQGAINPGAIFDEDLEGSTADYIEAITDNALTDWETFWSMIEQRRNDAAGNILAGFEEDGFEGAFDALVEEIELAWEDVRPALVELYESRIKPYLEEEGGALITDALNALGSRFGAWVEESAIPAAVAALPGFTLAVLSALTDLKDQMVNSLIAAAAEAVESMYQSFTSSLPTLLGFFTGLSPAFITALGNLGSTLYSAGSDLIQGLIDGIGSRVGDVLAEVGGLAGRVVGAVRDKLDSDSPSKVFIKIGYDVMEGLDIGLGEGFKPIPANLTALTEQLTSVDISPPYIAPFEQTGQSSIHQGATTTINIQAKDRPLESEIHEQLILSGVRR